MDGASLGRDWPARIDETLKARKFTAALIEIDCAVIIMLRHTYD